MTKLDPVNNEYFEQPVYALNKHDKAAFFVRELQVLSQFHQRNCPEYQTFISTFSDLNRQVDAHCTRNSTQNTLTPTELNPLAVRLFKDNILKSIPDDEIYKELNSSGTTGMPSRIFLNADTAKLQSKMLIKILQHWIGPKRLPLLLIDAPNTVKKGTGMTARAAGLQGLSFLGYDHTYALDENMQLNLPVVTDFFEKHQNSKILMFGFTFMVWQYFIQQLNLKNQQFKLNDALLLHGGGWKKLQEQAVSNETFKQTVQHCLGNVNVHDYYGMVEQTGTIYVECEQGHLHCSVWSDVLIRNPIDLSVCKHHEVGVIQVNSLAAHSYPGHSILTEDLGVILGEDDCACGRKGKYFQVKGRVPKAENRGCSDTFS